MTPQERQDFNLWSSALNTLSRNIKLAESKHYSMREANFSARVVKRPEPYTTEDLRGAQQHYESLKWKLVEARKACAEGHLYLIWKLTHD